MNKLSKRGSSLVQYGIIIALIALVLVPVFFFTGKYLFSSFESFYETIKNNNPASTNNNTSNNTTNTSSNNASSNITDNDVINGSIKAGELGGTSEKPAFKCAGEVCTIDYGEFVLNGVPADFGGMVQSSGTSGGTEEICSLIEQIATQIEKDNPEGAAELKNLANYSHILGYIQKQVELKANECKTYSDPSKCLRNFLYSKMNKAINLPSEYKVMIPDFEAKHGNNNTFNGLLDYCHIGNMRNKNIHIIDKSAIQSYPSLEVINSFDKIQASQNLSPEIKSLTKELYLNLNNLSYMISGLSSNVTSPDSGDMPYLDPFTGKNELDKTNTFSVSSMDDILHPQISTKSHGDASVICLTGRNSDNGYKCK